MKAMEPSSGRDDQMCISWPYYVNMSFLDITSEKRKSLSNGYNSISI